MGLIPFLFSKVFPSKRKSADGTIYDFKIRDIEGAEIDFQAYKEKKILIVNTASKCGYTGQYADLEKLHREFGDQVSVLVFPSNDFLWQEPGTNEEIVSFCKNKFDVTFKMFSKISVRGRSQHRLYQWLEAKTGNAPSWNFCKYLVSKDGTVVQFFNSKVNPLDPKITQEFSPQSN